MCNSQPATGHPGGNHLQDHCGAVAMYVHDVISLGDFRERPDVRERMGDLALDYVYLDSKPIHHLPKCGGRLIDGDISYSHAILIHRLQKIADDNGDTAFFGRHRAYHQETQCIHAVINYCYCLFIVAFRPFSF